MVLFSGPAVTDGNSPEHLSGQGEPADPKVPLQNVTERNQPELFPPGFSSGPGFPLVLVFFWSWFRLPCYLPPPPLCSAW